jgi:hypothetical protein
MEELSSCTRFSWACNGLPPSTDCCLPGVAFTPAMPHHRGARVGRVSVNESVGCHTLSVPEGARLPFVLWHCLQRRG